VRIEIRTPAGQALATAKQIKPFIIGFRKTENKVYANKADDTIIWIVDGEIRDIMKIERNIALFDKTVSMILGNRLVQGLAKLSPQQRLELRNMLENQTKVKLVKNADQMPDIKDWSESAI
jgi:hypothetical protein